MNELEKPLEEAHALAADDIKVQFALFNYNARKALQLKDMNYLNRAEANLAKISKEMDPATLLHLSSKMNGIRKLLSNNRSVSSDR